MISFKLMGMAPISCLVLIFALNFPFISSTTSSLSRGSSLSVENPSHVLMSSNGVFSAGFFPVGENVFCFGIWFSEPSTTINNLNVVWIANRDKPVNGQRSKFSLHNNGNLVLIDVERYTVWSSDTASNSSTQLHLLNNGNLVLVTKNGVALWESFAWPTDTLLPQQALTRNTKLVSSRSLTNYSSGFYSLYFDNDNTLRLLYDGPEVSSIYWPDPLLLSWQALRSTYNNSRIAMFDSWGNFSASDNFMISTTDYGAKLQRIFKMDIDGNLRGYSRKKQGDEWNISWVAMSQPCKIHGICGANSYCSYIPSSGRKCSCLPGYKMVSENDWSYGCQPGDFVLSCNNKSVEESFGFMHLPHIEYFGYDYAIPGNLTLDQCKSFCLKLCNCSSFQIKLVGSQYQCYQKVQLRNGYRTPGFEGDLYLKLPKALLNATSKDATNMCSIRLTTPLARTYEKRKQSASVRFMLKFASAVGGLEIVCAFVVLFFVTRRGSGGQQDSEVELLAQGYLQAATGFRRFTYSELKKATNGFKEEIGRGGGGVVYKGTLSDQRVAAIKKLNVANQGEAEFFAEVSLIGKLYHMNLIEMWGYCVEAEHTILVYEYMEHGSLAKHLSSNVLDWKKKYWIALGTAKGLNYLHEECLEWVLHCDVKPENILLDSNYNPKVADFGLSKLQNRGQHNSSNLSRIRGTRGYMAPEWVQNMTITSKVDVYSYGVVVLEMLTGKNPTECNFQFLGGVGGTHKKLSAKWVKENMDGAFTNVQNMGEKDEDYEGKLEILVKVALQCLEEDRDTRPSMSQVVEMLLHHELYL